MERYTLAVVEFLRDHPGVCDVRFSRGAPLPEARLLEWERANAPYRLPGDLRRFFAQSDGFAVRWSVSAGAAGVADVGDMSIGSIDRLAPVPLDASPADDPWACSGVPGQPELGGDVDLDGLEDDDDETSDARRRRPAAAFDLAACPRAFGTVALVYLSRLRRDHKNDHTRAPRCSHDTEVWFQDPAARWWFLAKSFSAYFRLAHANLGLPNWQARETDVGMDPDSNAWFRWMAPQTLALDVERGVVRRMKKKRDAKRDRERASPPRFATEKAKDAKPSARASRRLGAAAAAAVGADRGGRVREKPRRTDSRGFRS
jgi:tubulin polyglutamylase complex subunit 2